MKVSLTDHPLSLFIIMICSKLTGDLPQVVGRCAAKTAGGSKHPLKCPIQNLGNKTGFHSA